jgi:hypothetical protein
MYGAKRNQSAKNDRRCKREFEPRRADTRRSFLRVRYFPHDVRFSRHGFRFTAHGGLTPAAPGFAFASRRTMFDSRGTMFGSPTHGGLTPTALANMRLCIANGALCGERMSCTRSGWREPAVGNTGMLAGEKRISATTPAHAAKSGWREPAVVREAKVRCET